MKATSLIPGSSWGTRVRAQSAEDLDQFLQSCRTQFNALHSSPASKPKVKELSPRDAQTPETPTMDTMSEQALSATLPENPGPRTGGSREASEDHPAESKSQTSPLPPLHPQSHSLGGSSEEVVILRRRLTSCQNAWDKDRQELAQVKKELRELQEQVSPGGPWLQARASVQDAETCPSAEGLAFGFPDPDALPSCARPPSAASGTSPTPASSPAADAVIVAGLLSKVDMAREEAASLRSLLAAAVDREKRLMDQLASTQEEAAARNAQVAALQAAMEAAHVGAERYAQDMSTRHAREVDACKQQAAAAEAALAEATDQHRGQVAQLQQRVAELEEQLQASEESGAEQSQRAAAAHVEVERLTAELATSHGHLLRLQSSNEVMESHCNQAVEEVSRLRGELHVLSARLSSRASSTKQLELQVQDAREVVEENALLREQVRALTHECSDRMAQVAAMQAALASLLRAVQEQAPPTPQRQGAGDAATGAPRVGLAAGTDRAASEGDVLAPRTPLQNATNRMLAPASPASTMGSATKPAMQRVDAPTPTARQEGDGPGSDEVTSSGNKAAPMRATTPAKLSAARVDTAAGLHPRELTETLLVAFDRMRAQWAEALGESRRQVAELEASLVRAQAEHARALARQQELVEAVDAQRCGAEQETGRAQRRQAEAEDALAQRERELAWTIAKGASVMHELHESQQENQRLARALEEAQQVAAAATREQQQLDTMSRHLEEQERAQEASRKELQRVSARYRDAWARLCQWREAFAHVAMPAAGTYGDGSRPDGGHRSPLVDDMEPPMSPVANNGRVDNSDTPAVPSEAASPSVREEGLLLALQERQVLMDQQQGLTTALASATEALATHAEDSVALQDLRAAHADLQRVHRALQEEHAQACEQLRAVAEEFGSARELLAAQEAEVAALHEAMRGAEQELTTAREDAVGQEGYLGAKLAELEAARAKLAEVTADRDSAERALTSAAREGSRLRALLQENEAALGHELARVRREMCEAGERAAREVGAAMEAGEADVRGVRQQVEEMRAEVAAMAEELAAVLANAAVASAAASQRGSTAADLVGTNVVEGAPNPPPTIAFVPTPHQLLDVVAVLGGVSVRMAGLLGMWCGPAGETSSPVGDACADEGSAQLASATSSMAPHAQLLPDASPTSATLLQPDTAAVIVATVPWEGMAWEDGIRQVHELAGTLQGQVASLAAAVMKDRQAAQALASEAEALRAQAVEREAVAARDLQVAAAQVEAARQAEEEAAQEAARAAEEHADTLMAREQHHTLLLKRYVASLAAAQEQVQALHAAASDASTLAERSRQQADETAQEAKRWQQQLAAVEAELEDVRGELATSQSHVRTLEARQQQLCDQREEEMTVLDETVVSCKRMRNRAVRHVALARTLRARRYRALVLAAATRVENKRLASALADSLARAEVAAVAAAQAEAHAIAAQEEKTAAQEEARAQAGVVGQLARAEEDKARLSGMLAAAVRVNEQLEGELARMRDQGAKDRSELLALAEDAAGSVAAQLREARRVWAHVEQVRQQGVGGQATEGHHAGTQGQRAQAEGDEHDDSESEDMGGAFEGSALVADDSTATSARPTDASTREDDTHGQLSTTAAVALMASPTQLAPWHPLAPPSPGAPLSSLSMIDDVMRTWRDACARKDVQIAALMEECTGTRRVCQQLQQQLVASEGREGALATQLDGARAHAQQAEARLAEVCAQLDATTAALERANRQLEEWQGQLAATQGELDARRAELERVSWEASASAEEARRVEALLAERDGELAAVREQLHRADLQLADATTRLEDTVGQLASAVARCEELTGDVLAARAHEAALEAALGAARASAEERQEALEESRAVGARLQGALDAAHAQLTQVTADRDDARTDCLHLEARLGVADGLCEQLRGEVADASARCTQLEAERDVCEDTCRRQQQQLADVTVRCGEIEEQAASLAARGGQLAQALEASNARCVQLDLLLDAAQEEGRTALETAQAGAQRGEELDGELRGVRQALALASLRADAAERAEVDTSARLVEVEAAASSARATAEEHARSLSSIQEAWKRSAAELEAAEERAAGFGAALTSCLSAMRAASLQLGQIQARGSAAPADADADAGVDDGIGDGSQREGSQGVPAMAATPVHMGTEHAGGGAVPAGLCWPRDMEAARSDATTCNVDGVRIEEQRLAVAVAGVAVLLASVRSQANATDQQLTDALAATFESKELLAAASQARALLERQLADAVDAREEAGRQLAKAARARAEGRMGELALLRAWASDHEAAAADVAESLRASQQAQEETSAALQETALRCAAAEQDLFLASANLHQAREERQVVEAQRDELAQQLAAVRDELARTAQQAGADQQEVAALQQQQEQLEEEVEELMAQLEGRAAVLASMEGELARAREDTTDASNRARRLAEELACAEERVASLEAQLQHERTAANAQSSMAAAHAQRVATLAVTLRAATAELRQVLPAHGEGMAGGPGEEEAGLGVPSEGSEESLTMPRLLPPPGEEAPVLPLARWTHSPSKSPLSGGVVEHPHPLVLTMGRDRDRGSNSNDTDNSNSDGDAAVGASLLRVVAEVVARSIAREAQLAAAKVQAQATTPLKICDGALLPQGGGRLRLLPAGVATPRSPALHCTPERGRYALDKMTADSTDGEVSEAGGALVPVTVEEVVDMWRCACQHREDLLAAATARLEESTQQALQLEADVEDARAALEAAAAEHANRAQELARQAEAGRAEHDQQLRAARAAVVAAEASAGVAEERRRTLEAALAESQSRARQLGEDLAQVRAALAREQRAREAAAAACGDAEARLASAEAGTRADMAEAEAAVAEMQTVLLRAEEQRTHAKAEVAVLQGALEGEQRRAGEAMAAAARAQATCTEAMEELQRATVAQAAVVREKEAAEARAAALNAELEGATLLGASLRAALQVAEAAARDAAVREAATVSQLAAAEAAAGEVATLRSALERAEAQEKAALRKVRDVQSLAIHEREKCIAASSRAEALQASLSRLTAAADTAADTLRHATDRALGGGGGGPGQAPLALPALSFGAEGAGALVRDTRPDVKLAAVAAVAEACLAGLHHELLHKREAVNSLQAEVAALSNQSGAASQHAHAAADKLAMSLEELAGCRKEIEDLRSRLGRKERECKEFARMVKAWEMMRASKDSQIAFLLERCKKSEETVMPKLGAPPLMPQDNGFAYDALQQSATGTDGHALHAVHTPLPEKLLQSALSPASSSSQASSSLAGKRVAGPVVIRSQPLKTYTIFE
eukprot:jgi/Mesvir1/13454/Mv16515-RA.1